MMLRFLIPLLFFSVFSLSQNRKAQFILDPQGKKTGETFRALFDKYPENAMAFRMTKDSGRVYHYNAPRYSAYRLNYCDSRSELEKLTGKKYPESTTFILYFVYKDDACSDHFSNVVKSSDIAARKEFSNPIKIQIENKYPNTVFLVFYDSAIILQNKPESEKEYFYSDKDRYLRTSIFQHPTVCGSFAVLKSDGTTLVRNGEYRADWMADHLNPEIWDSIFKP